MRLCMLVLTQDMSKGTQYDSPLMHYLAVRGIDATSQTLRSPFTYTPILGRMLWIVRLIMLEITVPAVAWPELGLECKEAIASVPDRVRTMRAKHLCEGSWSPTSSILSQLAMGKKYNKVHQSPSNIHWSADAQTIYYGGEPVTLSRVRTMCSELIRQLQASMRSLVFRQAVPPIDLGSIVDSMAWSSEFRRAEYSFITHVKNRDRTDVGWEYLYSRARQDRKEWRLFRSTDRTKWNPAQKRAYLRKEGQFLQTLMLVMHVTGGQPARGPEIGSVKVSNSIYSARNVYVINGRMCFLTMYDKARKRRGNTDYIVRFLSDPVSQILAQYLVYVRPFARALDQRESEYLFAGSYGPWAGNELTAAMVRASQKYLGTRVTTQGWRHIAIGIAVRHLMRASQTWETDGDEGEGEDEFAGGENEEELELDTFRHIIVR